MSVGIRTATACKDLSVIVELGIIMRDGISKYMIWDIILVVNFGG
jgi:hypothetical protein